MTGVIGYARTFLRGGEFAPPRLATFAEEIARFHDTLEALRTDFEDTSLIAAITDEQFLQGPLADAMTHVARRGRALCSHRRGRITSDTHRERRLHRILNREPERLNAPVNHVLHPPESNCCSRV